MNGKPIVRTFAPEQWGQVDRFANFYSGTFEFPDHVKKAVSGSANHFRKALILRNLAIKMKPNLEIDWQQLEINGYTAAENSKELSAVIEGVFTELYSSIDCTRKIIREIYKSCRGLPDSTRKMFHNIRNGKVGDDFPHGLILAFQEAVWYDDLMAVRDELTHSDVGQCRLNKKSDCVSYTHMGMRSKGEPLVIDNIFHVVEVLIGGVNKFMGMVFFHLNSLLKQEPMFQVCGFFYGRCYTRHVAPSVDINFNSGTCDSHIWFDRSDNPNCPLAECCGAYASAKSKSAM